MGFFDLFKKKKDEIPDELKKWDKMWELWANGKADSPYAELMTYQSEINNGGHDQYFTNVENTGDLQKEMSVLESILPENHIENLKKAYESYLILQKNEEDNAVTVLDKCDSFFYENEENLSEILNEYAAKIKL